MTDIEAIEILNKHPIDMKEPGAFDLLKAIGIAINALRERVEREGGNQNDGR